MSSDSTFRPLLAIADSYLSETITKGSDTYVVLRNVLHKYILDEITIDKATLIFQENSAPTRALERISAILNVSNTPIFPNESSQQFNLVNGLRKKTNPWNEYEDQRLLCAIHRYGLDNWGPVSQFVGNGRTRAQCSQRWFRGLDPRISKVLWTMEEEQNLLKLIEIYGDRAWTKISSELGTRSDAQCRYHYKQMIKEKSMQNVVNYKKESENDMLQLPITMSAPILHSSDLNNANQQQVCIPNSPSRPSLPPISNILNSLNEQRISISPSPAAFLSFLPNFHNIKM